MIGWRGESVLKTPTPAGDRTESFQPPCLSRERGGPESSVVTNRPPLSFRSSADHRSDLRSASLGIDKVNCTSADLIDFPSSLPGLSSV